MRYGHNVKDSLLNRSKTLQKQLAACDEKRRKLTSQLADLGYICQGSVVRQFATCGTASCRCRKDPKNRHGPYIYWTTKVNGKTVARRLPEEEAVLYEEWIANRHSLDNT